MEDYKIFTTLKDELTFKYPHYWLDEMEDGNTYVFFEEFLGSLRVTPQIIKNPNWDATEFLLKEFESKKALEPEWKKLGKHNYVSYEDDLDSGNTIIHVHYFITAFNNIALNCSFAYDSTVIDDPVGADEIKKELEGVLDALKTIVFKGEKK